MTFRLTARTLPFVVYSQIRTLVSLVAVLAMAVVFLWVGSRLLNTVTGAAPPAPTATVQAAIEQPTVPPVATRKPKNVVHLRPSPTEPAPPRASPTPKAPPEVIITNSLSPDNPQTVFHTGASYSTCWIRNSSLPLGSSSVTFNWVEDSPLSNHFLYQFPVSRSAGVYTGAYYVYVAQNPGKYHCDVIVNGQVAGTAHFTVLP